MSTERSRLGFSTELDTWLRVVDARKAGSWRGGLNVPMPQHWGAPTR